MLAIETKPIVEQLVDIAREYETSYKGVHSYTHDYNYHNAMLAKGAIITYLVDGVVLGYFEVWRINYHQFGRLICHDNWNQLDEDITTGNLAYVANTWIHPDFRQGAVYKVLRNRFFAMCNKCEYYCGSALRKRTQPIKVFKVKDLVNKLYKGEPNGK